MKYHFSILINLVAIISIGKFSPIFDAQNLKHLDRNCAHQIDELSQKLERDVISENKTVVYFVHAIPYVHLLLLNSVIECCKVPGRFMNIDQRNISQFNKPVCPMNYPSTFKNIEIGLSNSVQYLNNERNCYAVCNLNSDINNSCRLILLVNELIKASTKEELTVTKGKEEPLQKSDDKAVNPQAAKDLTVINDQGIEVTPAVVTGDSVLPQKKIETLSKEAENSNKAKAGEDGATKLKNEKSVNVKDGFPIKDENFGAGKIIVTENKDFVVSNKATENIKPPNLPIIENTDLPESELPPLSDQQLLRSKSDNKNNNNYEKGYGDGSHLKISGNEGEDDENNDEDLGKPGVQDPLPDREPEFGKSMNTKEIYSSDNFFQAEDSHFSAYFLMTISIIIIGYVVYHNKNKIVAYALEGRRSKSGRRRPTSASYRKLDSNLEEAIASNPSNASVTNVVY